MSRIHWKLSGHLHVCHPSLTVSFLDAELCKIIAQAVPIFADLSFFWKDTRLTKEQRSTLNLGMFCVTQTNHGHLPPAASHHDLTTLLTPLQM